MPTRPSRTRRAIAVLLTALFAVTGAAVVSAAPASAAATPITGGSIDWGFKASFRSYVTTIAAGNISLTAAINGVAPARAAAINVPVRTQSTQGVNGTDTYRFGVVPGGTNDSATRTATVESGGQVRFTSAAHGFDIVLDNLRANLNGDTGTLVVDLSQKPAPTPEVPNPAFVLSDDLVLADLDLTGITPTTSNGVATYTGIHAAITAAGAAAFNGMYPAGTALDDLTVAVREGSPAIPTVTGTAIDSGSLRWTVNRQVWTQTGLSQCLEATDGATNTGTKNDAGYDDPASGVSFPIESGTYDEATGATALDLGGTLVVGNFAQGNFRMKLADLKYTVSAAGRWVLTGDVSTSLTGAAGTCGNAARTFTGLSDDVVIAQGAGGLTRTGGKVSGEQLPEFASNVYSFDPLFIQAVDPSLRAFFLVSDGNPNTTGTPAITSGFRRSGAPIRTSFSLRGLGYTGVTPSRICDTRAAGGSIPANQCNGNGSGTGKLGPNGQRDVQVAGLGGVPANGATAVVLNVAVTNTTGASFLTVFPQGTARPNAANVNWAVGKTVSNLVEVPISPSGQITVWNSTGNVDVVADVQGYVSNGPVWSGVYSPLTPARVCDSRPAAPSVPSNQCNNGGPASGIVGPAGTKEVQITGQGGVPASGVSAVVLNVAVTGTTGNSFLTAYPAGQALPNAANVNWTAGQTTSNRVIVPVGVDGKISLHNSLGNTQVIVDVNGWFSDASNPLQTGGHYTALNPTRICDSRAVSPGISANQCNGNGAGAAPIGPGGTKNVAITGGLVPAGAKAVVLNVAVTGTTGNSFLIAYPHGVARPNTADLNWAAGQTVSNLVVVKLPEDGTMDLWQQLGTTNVVVDVQGYYL